MGPFSRGPACACPRRDSAVSIKGVARFRSVALGHVLLALLSRPEGRCRRSPLGIAAGCLLTIVIMLYFGVSRDLEDVKGRRVSFVGCTEEMKSASSYAISWDVCDDEGKTGEVISHVLGHILFEGTLKEFCGVQRRELRNVPRQN